MQQQINELEINGVTYVQKNQNATLSAANVNPIKIVILQRGWVYIGRFERDGNDCKLFNAFCIRKWGTEKGLVQLVNGPTSNTVLDKCEGVVEFDYLTLVHSITVNASKWSQVE